MGRLTLNPLRHLDPIGFVCLLFSRFGWAKPVPVNPYAFRTVDAKTGMLLTALAGPLSNILLCFISVGIWSAMLGQMGFSFSWLRYFLEYLMWINASLAFFNLIPVPPLDGSKVLAGLLPDRFYHISQMLEQYGFVFLLILLISRIPEMILGPLSSGLITAFSSFFRLFA
jgi:Zn-dependent protease